MTNASKSLKPMAVLCPAFTVLVVSASLVAYYTKARWYATIVTGTTRAARHNVRGDVDSRCDDIDDISSGFNVEDNNYL